MHILNDNLSSCMLARDIYLNCSLKNQCNASEIHYMAKPIIQNKEMTKFETKISFIYKIGRAHV